MTTNAGAERLHGLHGDVARRLDTSLALLLDERKRALRLGTSGVRILDGSIAGEQPRDVLPGAVVRRQ